MLSRLDRSVPAGTNVVIVQGGYNDLVDGVPPSQTVANLNEILARLHARHIKSVLCGFFDPNWDAIFVLTGLIALDKFRPLTALRV
jgi:lysophospholipase L1-like esterase